MTDKHIYNKLLFNCQWCRSKLFSILVEHVEARMCVSNSSFNWTKNNKQFSSTRFNYCLSIPMYFNVLILINHYHPFSVSRLCQIGEDYMWKLCAISHVRLTEPIVGKLQIQHACILSLLLLWNCCDIIYLGLYFSYVLSNAADASTSWNGKTMDPSQI